MRLLEKLRRRPEPKRQEFTGSCPIREHTGEGSYVGRCEFATYGGFCPRHGWVAQFLGNGADLREADDRTHERLFPGG